MTSYDFATAQMAERDRKRTPKGWPRPRRPDHEGNTWPVAWITLPPDFATMDADRGKEALEDRLCQVCGEGHDPGSDVIIFLDSELRDAETFERVHPGYDFPPDPRTSLDSLVLKAKDGAMLHERCAKLAMGACPHLYGARDKGNLFGFTGPVERVFLRKFDGRPSEVYLPGVAARVWIMPE